MNFLRDIRLAARVLIKAPAFTLAALAAALIPALRASRTDPLTALREE